jgi:hypothetical protein
MLAGAGEILSVTPVRAGARGVEHGHSTARRPLGVAQPLKNLVCTLVQNRGLVAKGLTGQNVGQIAKRPRDLRVGRVKPRLSNSERAAEQYLRFARPAEICEHFPEARQRGSDVNIVRAEGCLTNRETGSEKEFGLLGVLELPVCHGEVGVAVRHVGMAYPQRFLADRNGVAKRGNRLLEAPEVDQRDSECNQAVRYFEVSSSENRLVLAYGGYQGR